MKLYFSSVTCALSPLIVLKEAGLDHEVVTVDLKTKILPDGRDFREISPFGFVPLLELDDGRHLGEGVAIIQYLGDLAPSSGLTEAHGSYEHYLQIGRLNFIATDLVRNFDLLFLFPGNEAVETAAKAALTRHYAHLDRILAAQP